MSTTYNLTIYIESALLKSGDVANLTFARYVNNEANVVFQSKTSEDFSASNTLSWKQSYRIGATQNLVDGILVS
jgi:hypothetical protein